jgi:hypothetical protein
LLKDILWLRWSVQAEREVTVMHLIEIFLPMYDATGSQFPNALYAETRDELVSRFGGLTAHSLTPASGLWRNADGEVLHDDLIVYEVIAERVERSWWSRYRQTLQQRFSQEVLVVRTNEISLL